MGSLLTLKKINMTAANVLVRRRKGSYSAEPVSVEDFGCGLCSVPSARFQGHSAGFIPAATEPPPQGWHPFPTWPVTICFLPPKIVKKQNMALALNNQQTKSKM
jgi:hypothetical protein